MEKQKNKTQEKEVEKICREKYHKFVRNLFQSHFVIVKLFVICQFIEYYAEKDVIKDFDNTFQYSWIKYSDCGFILD